MTLKRLAVNTEVWWTPLTNKQALVRRYRARIAGRPPHGGYSLIVHDPKFRPSMFAHEGRVLDGWLIAYVGRDELEPVSLVELLAELSAKPKSTPG